MELTSQQIEALQAYAAGRLGTRETIERIGMRDYADLLIAMVQADLPLPKPSASPRHDADVERARAILQPLLRNGD